MRLKGWKLKFNKDKLTFTRDPDTEVVPVEWAKWKGLRKDNGGTLVIPFQYILRIYVGEQTRAYYLNISAAAKPLKGNDKLWPDRYYFIPYDDDVDDLQEFVKYLNFAVFGHPDPPLRTFRIFVNPKSGKGNASKVFREDIVVLFDLLGTTVIDDQTAARRGVAPNESVYTITQRRGHAKDIVKSMELDQFNTIVCVGGDGTVHEVINGLAERPDAPNAFKMIHIATVPCGSGNALSTSLFGDCDPTEAAVQALRGKPMLLDLMSVSPVDQSKRTVWTFLSIAFGWIAHADIHTERLRFVGSSRFSIGVAWQMIAKKGYQCSYAIHGELYTPDPAKTALDQRKDTKKAIEDYYNDTYNDDDPPQISEDVDNRLKELVGTKRPTDHWSHTAVQKMYSFYAGKLPWTSKDAQAFPAALSNDGYIDLCILRGENLSYAKMLKIFSKFAQGGHYESDNVIYMKVKSFKLLPGVLHHQSIDHERLHNSVTPDPPAITNPSVAPPANTTSDGNPNGVGNSSDGTDGNSNTALANNNKPNPPIITTQPGPVPNPTPPATQKMIPPKPQNSDSKSFRDKFVLSIDGERYDPGHGIIVEVHQGLASIIGHCELGKYRPSKLHQPSVANIVGDGDDPEMDYDQWIEIWEQKRDQYVARLPELDRNNAEKNDGWGKTCAAL